MLIDPDNISMRYNLACLLGKTLGDADGAVEMLGPFLNAASRTQLGHCDVDPDIDPIRTHPRFVELRAKARARLGITD
jgi:adenylate cyclase